MNDVQMEVAQRLTDVAKRLAKASRELISDEHAPEDILAEITVAILELRNTEELIVK